jgi:aminopeptidase YwaD
MKSPCPRLALLSLLPLTLLGAVHARAEERAGLDPLAGLSGAKALALATELAADKFQGRKTGHASGRRAEDWIANQMGTMGLDPRDASGAYLEAFTFVTTQAKEPIACVLDGKALEYGVEYVDLLYSGAGEVEAPVVFVGYGVSRPDLGWDELAGADVKGKIVLALRGAPPAHAAQMAEERAIGWKSAKARSLGARGFLICEGERPVVGTIQERHFRADLPALWVGTAVADRLLAGAGTTLAEQRKAREGAAPPQPLALAARAKVQVTTDVQQRARGANALGAIPGRDPDLRREIVLVGAHVDHLGVDAKGRVYNGADDNASGTAVILHLAETLLEAGWKPKRTVLFVGFGAEEQGLVGSQRLAEDGLPFEHDAIVCVLNVDMVGQGTTAVTLGGSKTFPAFAQRLLGYLPAALGKDVVAEGEVERNGDHWPFAQRGIPAFMLATRGEHPNYHGLDDDIERLKPECLEAAARVLGALVVRLADEPASLKDAR